MVKCIFFKTAQTIAGLLLIAVLIWVLHWCFAPVLYPLPKPSGAYGVGFDEFFLPTSSSVQVKNYPINVQMWYPTDEQLVLKYPNKVSRTLQAHLKKHPIFIYAHGLVH